MKRSTPVFVLKREAKAIAKREQVRLHVALDRVARREGYRAWSHLAADVPASDASAAVLDWLAPGDLVLVAARPRQGKTLLAAALVAEAIGRGGHAAFFTLAVAAREVDQYFLHVGKATGLARGRLYLDDADGISARYVRERLADAPPGVLVVIDYLQLLDQRRDHPRLADQVAELAHLASERRAIVVVLAQVRRDFRPGAKRFPDLTDVRLPNPVDLAVFTKACFLEGGRVEMVDAA